MAFAVTSAATITAQTAQQTSLSKQQTAKAQPAQATMSADERFAHHVAAVNMAEVELGKLAADKASNARVKEFANQMVTDHNKAGEELRNWATSKNVTLPTALDAKHKTVRDRLAGMSAAAFDRAYIDEMVKGHQQAVADFRKESTTGTDAELKAWAAKTLTTVEGHYKMAQDIQKEVGHAKPTTH
jgi:putative membrane protein